MLKLINIKHQQPRIKDLGEYTLSNTPVYYAMKDNKVRVF